jgi:hypothetical protein
VPLGGAAGKRAAPLQDVAVRARRRPAQQLARRRLLPPRQLHLQRVRMRRLANVCGRQRNFVSRGRRIRL